ncbi:hypothetical protein QUA32_02465 [Microcoleus sp. Pol14D6]|uniref:hypothetical protein n=1 Tax=unclassified Microcoleus TaxID=2642155 RepID=UPI002FD4697F
MYVGGLETAGFIFNPTLAHPTRSSSCKKASSSVVGAIAWKLWKLAFLQRSKTIWPLIGIWSIAPNR